MRWVIDDFEAIDNISSSPASMEDAGRWMFEDAMNGGELTDMEFVLDSGRKIRGHKLWLMARCEYLRGMLRSGMQEGKTGIVPVRECSDGAFVAVLQYIYTGRLGFQDFDYHCEHHCWEQDWEELWDLADLFGAEGMRVRLLDAVSFDNLENAARVAAKRGIKELVPICARVVEGYYWRCGDCPGDARLVVNVVEMLRGVDGTFEWELEGKAMQTVLASMRALEDDALVQEKGCAALRHAKMPASFREKKEEPDFFSVNASYSPRMVIERDGENYYASQWYARLMTSTVQSVISALVRHPDDAEVQEQACAALSNLSVFLGDRNCVKDEFSNWDSPVLLSALTLHRDIAKVQQQACRALSVVCHHHVKNQRIAGESPGLVKAVVDALDFHRDDPLVQQHACAAIASLCSSSTQPCLYFYRQEEVRASEENRDRAIRAGAAESILDAVLAFEDNQEVRKQGYLALRNLGARAVAGLMEGVRKGNAKVQEIGLVVITAMCVCDDPDADPDAPDHSVHCEGFCGPKLVKGHAGAKFVELTVLALREHANNSSIQQKGCQALRSICGQRETWVDGDVFAEAWVAVLAAIQAFASNPDVQRHGCAALSALCQRFNSDSYSSIVCSVEGQRLPGFARVVDALVGAIKGHTSSADVQKRGCAALRDFCSPRLPDGPAKVEHRDLVVRRVVEAGGLEAIVEALGNHASAADLHGRGCMALSTLLRDPENCRRVLEADGALETIVGVLKASARMVTEAHQEVDEEVDEEEDEAKMTGIRGDKKVLRSNEEKISEQIHALTAVCGVLVSLCIDVGSRRRAGDAGAIEAITEASRALQTAGKSDRLDDCFQILSRLCADVENRRMARQCGALEVVAEAINDHARGMQHSWETLMCFGRNYQRSGIGCEAICAICPLGEIHDGAAEQKAVRAVVKLIRIIGEGDFALRYSERTPAGPTKQAYSALRHLCYLSDTNRQCAQSFRKGFTAADSVVNSLRNHVNDAGVQEHGCAALIIFCHGFPESEKVKSYVGRCAVNAVVAGLRAHESNPEVQAQGYEALNVLCSDQESKRRATELGVVERGGQGGLTLLRRGPRRVPGSKKSRW